MVPIDDALVPVEEDDSEPVAQAGSSNAQTATAAAAAKGMWCYQLHSYSSLLVNCVCFPSL